MSNSLYIYKHWTSKVDSDDKSIQSKLMSLNVLVIE